MCVCVCSHGITFVDENPTLHFPIVPTDAAILLTIKNWRSAARQGETGRRLLGRPRSEDGSMGRSRRRYFHSLIIVVPTRWPRGQRRRPIATRLLRLRIWTPRKYGCLSLVNVACCCRKRPLERADHSSRGVLPTVSVSLFVITCNGDLLLTLLHYLAMFLYLVLLLYSVIYFKLTQLHYSAMFTSVGCIALFSHICFSWLC